MPVHALLRTDRLSGMLCGLAIGDSLGNTSEGMLPDARKSRYGEIRGYLPNRYAAGKAIGLPTDDTQLSFWALEQILADGRVDPSHISDRFMRGHIFGIGNSVKQFLMARALGKPWQEAAPESAGNGALMRVAPLILPSLLKGGEELIADIALGSMVTHNDSASISACAAFGLMLRELLYMEAPPAAHWWINRYVELASKLETEKTYTSRSPYFSGFQGRLSDFVNTEVRTAVDRGVSVLDACNRWYAGAYLLETVPSVLFILARYGHDPDEAIVRAVNDTVDNDTIAAIVGMAVGALHGKNALPESWITGLSGRTGSADDGRVFELIDQAVKRYAR